MVVGFVIDTYNSDPICSFSFSIPASLISRSLTSGLASISTICSGAIGDFQHTDIEESKKQQVNRHDPNSHMLLKVAKHHGHKGAANVLYKYMDAAPAYAITVDGVQVAAESNGYAIIQRKWKKGDVIELNFPMEMRRVVANDNAEDDRGKVALERGPIVYCLEGNDQADGKVFNKYILNTSKITASYDANLLNGVVTLSGDAKELQQDGTIKDVKFRAIPYSTWNNRGPQQMEIWIAASPTYAIATPLQTISSKAMTFCNRGPIQNDAPETAPVDSWAGGTNDQWEPKRSSDTSKPYHYWWLKQGTTEAISYQFDKEYEVSNVQVYWLDFDHYDGNFRTPESWSLYYKDQNGDWQEVKDHSAYTVRKDCYNSVDFAPVKTTGLKILAKLQKGQSGGVLEWKVNH